MSANAGLLFINKAIQAESFSVFAKYGIREDSFVSASERKFYRFIEDYHDKQGQMPSYALMADTFDDFVYVPDITDRFEPLAEGIANRKLAVEFNRFFERDFESIKEATNGDTSALISQLTESLNDIRLKYTNTSSPLTSIKTSASDYINEYKRRQLGGSFDTWESFLPFLNEELGGYTSGNLYVWYGRSGRGKSAIVLREALEIAQQGATVLIWSLEMSTYDVLTRLYTMLSAKLEKTTVTIDGEKRKAGFDSRDLRNGHLSADFERVFTEMLETINEHVEGNIVIRAVDDLDFNTRNVAQLHSDIESTNADVAIIDPMYYMDYETNTSKTAGGDAAETSKRLRRLAGALNVVLMTMTQAEEDEKESKENAVRTLKLPKRSEVKKTKALLEDASALIAIDTDYTQSRGIVGINKGRNGGEGTSCELTFLPNYGIIEQLLIDGDMFDF
ncbi:DnaB helicase C-terminal domain-containing protein [Macrococcus capreoli]|uniref:DnaB helicase C-terminal domain-containing protein n=1 Tax=Macrococcus capreoli TaxID=2982690 RepID=UPI0021D58384|nr:DnaB helicase C-terminal domain-containing protein [Macrococcus sp. TMW 2.2395]MCU7556595.1 DnaB helicase C-terminal domain-containing protein [Macrococcus sp. TMW 2.2395]